jgi:hypothetical protein
VLPQNARTSAVFFAVAICLVGTSTFSMAEDFTVEAPAADEWNVSLNGTWDFAAPDSAEFQKVEVPGLWPEPKAGAEKEKLPLWRTGTYRRSFDVREGFSAVAEVSMLRWGGEFEVNGLNVGSHDLGYAPAVIDLSHALKSGTNLLQVKPRGWTTIKREQNTMVIPSGASNWFGARKGGMLDDVWLRMYRRAKLGMLQIDPKMEGPSLSLKAEVSSPKEAWKGRLCVQVLSKDRKRALSPVVTSDMIELPAGAMQLVEILSVNAPDAQLWSTNNPALYQAVAWLKSDAGEVCAVRQERFGFREISTRDGRFCLNHKPLALHGATEYVDVWFQQMPEVLLHDVQVKLFKQMNGRAFRSHMEPLPRRWLDLCDENGVLVISEFPNFPDVQRKQESPYDLPEYWANLQREARGIVAVRTNHPSIIAWSVSNEGNGFGDWERQNLVPFVKAIDPSRLIMLSADLTEHFADSHNFMGLWYGTHSDFERMAKDLAKAYLQTIVGNSEYGQFEPSKTWYGPHKISWGSDTFNHDRAMLLMEQTEVLRRARYDLIMPYMYSEWWIGEAIRTGKVGDVLPSFHALRHALAPLAVSLDLDNRHALAGSKLRVPVFAMSDANDAQGRVGIEVLLLRKHPGFDWNGDEATVEILTRASLNLEVKAWEAKSEICELTLPADAGTYCVAAVMKKQGEMKNHAVSLRPVNVYASAPRAQRKLKVCVVEQDGAIAKWLQARGHEVLAIASAEIPDAVVVGEGMLYDGRLRQYGFQTEQRVLHGTRLVVLEQHLWDQKTMHPNIGRGLDRVVTAPLQCGVETIFPDAALNAELGEWLDYRRLNGCQHVGLRVALIPVDSALEQNKSGTTLAPEQSEGVKMKTAEANPWQPLFTVYAGGGAAIDWAVIQRKWGKADILCCQVPLSGRIDAQTNGADYDPVAERLLAWLIEAAIPEIAVPPKE